MLSAKRHIFLLQALLWTLSFCLFFFYLRQRLVHYPVSYTAGVALASFLSFAAIIYGYSFLYNRFFGKSGRPAFAGLVALLFLAVIPLRMVAEHFFVAPLTTGHSIFYFGRVHWTYTLTSCFFALIIGILLKSFAESVTLRERQAEIMKKHLETELKLLKAQVQPHFLFNSLNNLYYDTYKELPQVAERIAMLSDILRYFMEESPKERVPLSVELSFIENYMELERVRLPFPVDLQVEMKADEHLLVPPMLLIPLVENIFKHGIRGSGSRAEALIRLTEEQGRLQFYVRNEVRADKPPSGRAGTGLKNLKERLELLYPGAYTLETRTEDALFIAELTIPAHEN